MNGINVRKIAAVGAISLLGLSAVAVADVVYGSTQLVDQNGQPTVKIYVGSKAAISDGIAAANIAAKIANEAYKSSTLTAQVSGTPACSVGTGTTGAGTCSIVETSKKVTLSVTVPGTVAGAHTFKTLITDTIDKTLANRNSSRSEDNYTSATTSSDTSGSVTSPLRGVDGDVSRAKNLYRIGSGQFTAFGDNNVVDNQATGVTYTQEQAFWLGSTANGVAYDSSSLYKDVIVNKYRAIVYSTKFSGNDYGIPVCTGDLLSNTSDDWASCDTESNSRTDRHRLKVKFLGADWIISEMNDPAVTDASSVNVVVGGQIKLAKEAKYGIINVGQSLDAGTFKVRLSDISVAVGSANVHPAILDVLDANEQVVGQIQVNPGQTYTFTQSGTSDSVKVHVYKTAPGFTLSAKWAEMAIYNDEITLKDGQRYNLVSSSDADKDFKVSLMWKNRDYTGSSGGNDSSADSLREVVLYNIDGLDSKNKAGDAVSFPKGKPVYKLTFNGLDLTDDDYQSLGFSALSPDSYRVSQTSGDQACGATSSVDASYGSAKWIQISTSGNQYLGGSGTNLIAGGVMVDKVFFDPIGLITAPAALNLSAQSNANTTVTLSTGYRFAGTSVAGITSNFSTEANYTHLTQTTFTASSNVAPSTGWINIPAALLVRTDNLSGTYNQNTNATKWMPKLFWKLSGRDCYNWADVTYQTNPTVSGITDSQAVRFEKAGDNTAALGGIAFTNNVTAVGGSTSTLSTTFQGAILVKEDAGYYGVTSNNAVYTYVPFIANTSSSTDGTNGIRFKTTDSSTQNAYYYALGSSWTATEPTIVTERGSKVLSVGTSDFSMKVAKKIGQASFTFANSDSSSTSSDNSEDYIMKVGESKVFGGVTVAVKAIDATAGSCSVLGANGAPACTVDSTSLMAVVMPNNAASVVVNEPYTGSVSGLVAVDTDGPSANVAILVGGPAVNTMTDAALKDATVDLKKDGVVVKEIGKKIVVAGYTAADTLSAADLFVKGVQRQ